MTCLVPIDTAPTFDPREDVPAEDRRIEGLPKLLTWAQDSALSETKWDQVRTGVWQAEPGKTRSIKGETFEFCYILDGKVEIAEEGGAAHVFTAGDAFVMKPGFVGTWTTIETVRKIYVIAS